MAKKGSKMSKILGNLLCLSCPGRAGIDQAQRELLSRSESPIPPKPEPVKQKSLADLYEDAYLKRARIAAQERQEMIRTGKLIVE